MTKFISRFRVHWHVHHPSRHSVLALGIASVVGGLLLVTFVLTSWWTNGTQDVTSGGAGMEFSVWGPARVTVRKFDIPAQPLDEALERWSGSFPGATMFAVPADDRRALHATMSQELLGILTPRCALGLLLNGSGYTFTYHGDETGDDTYLFHSDSSHSKPIRALPVNCGGPSRAGHHSP